MAIAPDLSNARERAAASVGTVAIVMLSGLGVLMTSVLVTLPILAAAMRTQVGGDEASIGYLASADMFGCALACLIIARHIQKFDWRVIIRWALAGVVAGNLASIPLDSMAALLAARLFVGFCAGAALSIVFVALCHTPSPDRSFGIFVFLQLLLQAALLPAFAILNERLGVQSLYAGLIVVALLALVLLHYVPQGIARRDAEMNEGDQSPTASWGLATVIGLGIYFIAPAMIWAFFEPIGRNFGLDAITIGTALGFSGLAGIAGAAMVLLVPDRRMLWLVTGFGLSILSLLPIYDGNGFLTFLFVGCVFNFAWNFTYPYLMGVIANYDQGGDVAIYSLASQLLGLAGGPLVGSAIVASGASYGVMVGTALAILLASLFLFLRSEMHARRLVRQQAVLVR